jgi:hypothetical protein
VGLEDQTFGLDSDARDEGFPTSTQVMSYDDTRYRANSTMCIGCTTQPFTPDPTFNFRADFFGRPQLPVSKKHVVHKFDKQNGPCYRIHYDHFKATGTLASAHVVVRNVS